MKNEGHAKSGLSFNPDDSKYVTLEEADDNILDYEYLFLRVIQKEAAIIKLDSSSFTTSLSTFQSKIQSLRQFDFQGKEAIIISKA